MASQLQQQVLDFTRRLHSAEIERRDLRLEVNHLKDSHQNLAERADLAEHLGTEVVELQDQVRITLSRPWPENQFAIEEVLVVGGE